MTATAHGSIATETSRPRLGGVLWRAARASTSLTIGMAGKRWNPVFSVVEHTGRTSGRRYAAPVAARRVEAGFIISLAFGAQVDWYRNLVAAGGGTIRWRGRRYAVGTPERIDAAKALPEFLPVQRLFLRISGIEGYVRVRDADGAVA